jgi:hypothetical protein
MKPFRCVHIADGKVCGREYGSIDGMESHLITYHDIHPKNVPERPKIRPRMPERNRVGKHSKGWAK